MIFLGDIAMPSSVRPNTSQIKEIFRGEPVIANLEGPLVEHHQEKKYLSNKVLFNGIESVPFFKDLNVQLLNLANNHILDIPSKFESTLNILKENEIQSIGAGHSLKEAQSPVKLQHDNSEYIFVAFGWETIQCEPAGSGRRGVNPLQPSRVLKSIDTIRRDKPNAEIILLMHWNYELEDYPQPFDRQLAQSCIDEGASAVIGCHSHCVQGIEIYNGAPIVYSLGNWFIPQDTFFDGKLKFPKKTYLQIALEWEAGAEPVCHWFSYNPKDHQINYLDSENFSDSERLEKMTPFRGLNHRDYIEWFSQNRTKKLLLPIFKNIENEKSNKFKHNWVQLRGRLIDILLSLGIKKIRSGLD